MPVHAQEERGDRRKLQSSLSHHADSLYFSLKISTDERRSVEMNILPVDRKRKIRQRTEPTRKQVKLYIKLCASLLVIISAFASVTTISQVIALKANKQNETGQLASHPNPQHNTSSSVVNDLLPPKTKRNYKNNVAELPESQDLLVAPATLEPYRASAKEQLFATPVESQEPQSNFAPTGDFRAKLTPSVDSDAATLASNVEQPPQPVAGREPSLAELMAAGIIVGDLVGQHSQAYQNGDFDEDDGDIDGNAQANQQPAQVQQHFDDLPVTADRSASVQRNRNSPAVYTSDTQRQLIMNSVPQSSSAINEDGSAGDASEAGGQDLMYDKMPDSMEGLMRLEGEDTSDIVDTDSAAPGEGDAMQIRDGLGVAASTFGAEPRSTDGSEDDKFNDDGDDDDDDDDLVQITPAQAPVRALDDQQMTRPIPIHQAPFLSDQMSAIGAGGQLISPAIHNSLMDLNTAAGHYYGKKKKKKKVKKIVIKKKKKKKKKKYVKVKKIKVVKIKKKKKKKKKHHAPDHGKYYMYAKVPKKKSYEFGFKRGNKKHWIERHEKKHKNKFKTKVKWYDKKSKGKGFHIWDYNHHDKKKKHG